MTPQAMEALSTSVRRLRTLLQDDLAAQVDRRFRLAVPTNRAALDEKGQAQRTRLEAWLAERVRARAHFSKVPDEVLRADVRKSAESEMAARTLLRLILLRQLEACGVSRPAVLIGGWDSKGYREFRAHAPAFADGEYEGFDILLKALFDELAFDLPGLYGEHPLDSYFALSPAVLREAIGTLNAVDLRSAWQDDTTLGWVYQFWNDPEREAIDQRVGARGKVGVHEIASKTQLFTESYMVDWLLQNSVGRIALKMREIRDASGTEVESPWPMFVLRGASLDASGLPRRLSELKILDPACGSGHFLAGAFDLLVALYREEARDTGIEISDAQIADSILRHNLHGIDIDGRAVQVAAAVLYLKARRLARGARIPPLNLVSTEFDLDRLRDDDPALRALSCAVPGRGGDLAEIVGRLRHVSFRGSLMRFDPPTASHSDVRADQAVERFVEHHTRADDLGVRFDGAQIAAGLRLRTLLVEGRYDVVAFNPPYLATSKIDASPEILAEAFGVTPDIFAAFVQRAFELCKPTGLIAFVALSNWMFLSSFQSVRERMLEGSILLLVDVGKGAFRRASKLIQTTMVIASPSHEPQGIALAARIGSRDTISASQALDLARTLEDQSIYQPFEPHAFSRIEGAPLLFWLDPQFMQRYAELPKIGDVADCKGGIATTNNSRFLRAVWEVTPSLVVAALKDTAKAEHSPYIKGAEGREWIEPCRWLLRSRRGGLEIRTLLPTVRVDRPECIGVAYTTIGQRFGARLHTVPSVRDVSGASVFSGPTASVEALVCAMNRRAVRELASALNPTINFQLGDVRRLPFDAVSGTGEIVKVLRQEFAIAERGNELSPEYEGPVASRWAAAQAWAQRAVDRPPGTPLSPANLPEAEIDPWLLISHAVGVALGRFRAGGGIADIAPEESLAGGILFLGIAEASSLREGACDSMRKAWARVGPHIGGRDDLATYLKKCFFAEHKRLYEGRPIYLPLSSSKRSFVAFVSLHRWSHDTLSVILADCLFPEKRRLEGELVDLREARQTVARRGAAERRFTDAQKLLEELNDFVMKVTEVAERGPPPPDDKTPKREVDARHVTDLDDGVVVNSAALWSLLEPQWKDPKKWWTELASAEGKEDYDWSHLAARYFPTRVRKKCIEDPSLAAAHECLWELHPGKAYAWELRLQAEIRPDFTIDEPKSDATRAKFLAENAREATEVAATAQKRRGRTVANADDEAVVGPVFEGSDDALFGPR